MVEGKTKEKRHRRFRISYIFVGLFVFLIIAYFSYRFWLQGEYKTKLDEIRAAGYPATCAELDDWYSIRPGVENAADYFIRAAGYFVQWDIERRERLFFVGGAELPGPNEPVQQDVKELIAEFLEDNEKSLEILSEAAKIDNCRFPVNLRSGLLVRMPYLIDINYSTRILCLQAVYYIEQDKSQKALESIEAAFSVANSLSNEPILVSQLAGNRCKIAAVDALKFAINRADFNDSQLIVMDRLLADSEDLLSVQRGLIGERCFGIEWFNLSPSQISRLTGGRSTSADTVEFAMYKITGISDVDRLIYIDFMSKGIDAAGLPLHQREKFFLELESKINRLSEFHIVLYQMTPSLAGMWRREQTRVANIRTARVAVAIKRFYLSTGRYPDSLSELVLDFLPDVLKDPFDGIDIRFRKLDSGCIIYSIGEDSVDSCSRLSTLDINDFGDDIATIINK